MVWSIIASVIVAAGIFTLFKTRKQQLEVGFALNVITTGLALIVESFGTFTDKVFALLAGETSSNNLVQLAAGFILVCIGFWMLSYIKNKLTILNLLGFKERRIEEHRQDLGFNQFEFKEREIDLSYYAKKEMNYERFEDATELIDVKMESFYAENKEVNKGYTGTAPTPLTMYAGHRYKGGPTTEFFEYHKFDNKYHKLKKTNRLYFFKKQYPQLTLKQPLSDMNIDGAEEIVLGVSVTMSILPSQIKQFNAPFVHLSIPEPKQNAIVYEEQLYEYVQIVFNTIVELGKVQSIKKVHLVISSQSCLVFELGKLLTTETYMKEVINYHYVNDSSPQYPWGISFNHQGTRYIECRESGGETIEHNV